MEGAGEAGGFEDYAALKFTDDVTSDMDASSHNHNSALEDELAQQVAALPTEARAFLSQPQDVVQLLVQCVLRAAVSPNLLLQIPNTSVLRTPAQVAALLRQAPTARLAFFHHCRAFTPWTLVVDGESIHHDLRTLAGCGCTDCHPGLPLGSAPGVCHLIAGGQPFTGPCGEPLQIRYQGEEDIGNPKLLAFFVPQDADISRPAHELYAAKIKGKISGKGGSTWANGEAQVRVHKEAVEGGVRVFTPDLRAPSTLGGLKDNPVRLVVAVEADCRGEGGRGCLPAVSPPLQVKSSQGSSDGDRHLQLHVPFTQLHDISPEMHGNFLKGLVPVVGGMLGPSGPERLHRLLSTVAGFHAFHTSLGNALWAYLCPPLNGPQLHPLAGGALMTAVDRQFYTKGNKGEYSTATKAMHYLVWKGRLADGKGLPDNGTMTKVEKATKQAARATPQHHLHVYFDSGTSAVALSSVPEGKQASSALKLGSEGFVARLLLKGDVWQEDGEAPWECVGPFMQQACEDWASRKHWGRYLCHVAGGGMVALHLDPPRQGAGDRACERQKLQVATPSPTTRLRTTAAAFHGRRAGLEELQGVVEEIKSALAQHPGQHPHPYQLQGLPLAAAPPATPPAFFPPPSPHHAQASTSQAPLGGAYGSAYATPPPATHPTGHPGPPTNPSFANPMPSGSHMAPYGSGTGDYAWGQQSPGAQGIEGQRGSKRPRQAMTVVGGLGPIPTLVHDFQQQQLLWQQQQQQQQQHTAVPAQQQAAPLPMQLQGPGAAHNPAMHPPPTWWPPMPHGALGSEPQAAPAAQSEPGLDSGLSLDPNDLNWADIMSCSLDGFVEPSLLLPLL